jgi:hypothetical protein
VVVLLSLALWACGSDDAATTASTVTSVVATTEETVAPTTTEDTTPISEAPTSTVGVTTSVPASTAPPDTTPPPGAVDFEPACTEVSATGDTPSFDEAALDDLTSLGAAPAIRLTLPDIAGLPSDTMQYVGARIIRVPGGTLVLMGATSAYSMTSGGTSFPNGIAMVIDHDGTVRWRHCLAQAIGGLALAATDASHAPDTALVQVGTPTTAGEMPQWRTMSLADGAIGGDLSSVPGGEAFDAPLGLLTSSKDIAVFGPSLYEARPGERLAIVDLADLAVVEAPPVPDGFSSASVAVVGTSVRLTPFDDAGELIGGYTLVDGAWSDEPTDVADVVGPSASFEFDQNALVGRDADGAVVWTRDDLHLIPAEGLMSAVVGSVVVASSCDGESVQSLCDGEPHTGGYDLATGATLWEGPWLGIGPTGSSNLLVTLPDGGGWQLVDASTGEPVDAGQVWTGVSFGTECCGGDEFDRTESFGGLVVTLHQGVIEIWMPPALTGPTVGVTIG